MDKEKAVKTLASLLAKHSDSLIIKDDLYKKKLINGAEYFFQFSDPFVMHFGKFYLKIPDEGGQYYRWGFAGKDRTIRESHSVYKTLKDAIGGEECKDANYFFVDGSEGDQEINLFVTPYSIIGKKEINNLRGRFYKNVPPDIMSAMSSLGIADFTDLYRLYSTKGMAGGFVYDYYIYLKLEKLLSEFDFAPSDSHFFKSQIEELLGISVGELNKKLNKNTSLPFFGPYSGDKEAYTVKNRITQLKDELKAYSMFGKWIDLLPDFLNFVFTIPVEDQDVETNKTILSFLAEKIDYIGILANEYSKGDRFQEYFGCLGAEKQGRLVDSLKTLKDRKPVHDSFLWSKGFRDLSLDYLNLYQNDGPRFIEYFKGRSAEEQKTILKDIMGSDITNEKAIDWLNENHMDLIREVGFNE